MSAEFIAAFEQEDVHLAQGVIGEVGHCFHSTLESCQKGSKWCSTRNKLLKCNDE